jgi:hypothetical protein
MNVPFAVAGALALTAAAIHGGAGETLVVKRLRRDTLEPTPFGGPTMTLLMIRVTWHIVTLVFIVSGGALAVCMPASSATQACAAAGRISAVSFASYFVLAAGLAIAAQGRRVGHALAKHPGPIVFMIVAALSWWGSSGN